jgi:hypothetical protein
MKTTLAGLARLTRRSTLLPEMRLVALTEVRDDVEAETLLALLRSKGIECRCRRTDLAVGAWTGWVCTGGPLEILVAEEDLEAARELLPERVT